MVSILIKRAAMLAALVALTTTRCYAATSDAIRLPPFDTTANHVLGGVLAVAIAAVVYGFINPGAGDAAVTRHG